VRERVEGEAKERLPPHGPMGVRVRRMNGRRPARSRAQRGSGEIRVPLVSG
jgi:hypothetical protein